jgi:hypothetical protein
MTWEGSGRCCRSCGSHLHPNLQPWSSAPFIMCMSQRSTRSYHDNH